MRNTNGMVRRALVCIGAAALLGCTTPKKVSSPVKTPQKPPLVDKNSYGRKLISKFEKGTCTADADLGKVVFETDDGKKSEIHILPLDFVGDMISLHCLEKQTVITTSRTIIVSDKGYKDSIKNDYVDVFGEDSHGYDALFTPAKEEIVASVMLDNLLFVLMKNHNDGVYDMTVLDIKTQEHRTFELGNELYDKGVEMFVHKGVVFIVGEAEKGQDYLITLKMGDFLESGSFKAKKDLKGKISFEEQDDLLVLRIGDSETKIKVEKSMKEKDSKKTDCLKASEKEGSFDCITVSD